jgi:hypothetical protein
MVELGQHQHHITSAQWCPLSLWAGTDVASKMIAVTYFIYTMVVSESLSVQHSIFTYREGANLSVLCVCVCVWC